jgi:ubiquinone/menaquinone biosynthesis C-methylase UbiE
MKKAILACCLMLALSQAAFGQEDKGAMSDLAYLEHIAQFRTRLLQKNPESLKALGDLLENWKTGVFEGVKEEGLYNLKQRIINVGLSRRANLEEKLKWISIITRAYQMERALGEKDIQAIQDNVELLELIGAGLLDDEYPFKLNTKSDLLKELPLYGINEGDKIGEIGAGNGLFSLILSWAFPGVHLSINELELGMMEGLKEKVDSRSDSYNPAFMELFVGTVESTHMEGKELDKIIIRNTYHHFDNKRAMLASIAQSLKKNGDLFIFENIRSSFWKASDYCHKALTKKRILKVIERNGFHLVSEQLVGEAVLFHFVKKEKKKPS